MWEKDNEETEDEGADDFAEGGDEGELTLDTFRHVIIR
jgi:hypothetical protein